MWPLALAKGRFFAGAVERFGVARTYRAIYRVLGFPPELVSTVKEAESVYDFLEQENQRHANHNG